MKDFQKIVERATPHDTHDWLLPTAVVASGYGCSEGAIRNQKSRHPDELLKDVHWLKMPSSTGLYKVFWTKRGVIRLGFFLETERAKEFRSFAEALILGAVNGKSDDSPAVELPGPIVKSQLGTATRLNKPAAGLSQNDAMQSMQGLQPIKPEVIPPHITLYETQTHKQNSAQRHSPPYVEFIDDEEEWDEEVRSARKHPRSQNQNVNVTIVQSNDLFTCVYSWLIMTTFTVLLFTSCFWFVSWVFYLAPHHQPAQEAK